MRYKDQATTVFSEIADVIESSDNGRYAHKSVSSRLMNKELLDLADQYEGNLLNYFYGMTPEESRRFNKMVKDAKRKKQ